MAQAKKQTVTKKKRTAPKPEYAIRIVAKKSLKKPAPQAKKKTVFKKPKRSISLNKRLKFIFYCLLAVIVAVSALAIARAVQQANSAYEQAAKAADELRITSESDIAQARIVGATEKLMTEIDNYQSAPADLQAYALQDYRKFKQKCVVNGEIYGSLSYAIASVADAQYAQIKRNCNGAQTQILKKFGETWTVVYEGNTPPLCDLVNDLMIPQRVSLNCVIGGTTYLNPNP